MVAENLISHVQCAMQQVEENKVCGSVDHRLLGQNYSHQLVVVPESRRSYGRN